jgi:phosphatidate phosphatase APP1
MLYIVATNLPNFALVDLTAGMSQPFFYRVAKALSRSWDHSRVRLGLGSRKPLTIHTYRGFGTRDFLFMQGRVLRDKSIFRGDSDGPWRNLINTIKRFNSREINDAELAIRFADRDFQVKTDAEGFYRLMAQLDPPLPPPPAKPPFWQQAQIRLKAIPGQDDVELTQPGEVLIPSAAAFGIISDIDDTILKTYVTSWLKWRMIYLSILKNAVSRQAFRAVGPFFQALRRGATQADYNPFFYVSNSPWNLYDFLDDFLNQHKLPRGPILLRDFGLPYRDRHRDYRGHKHEQIIQILELYPDLPFVLIGDSGEKDTDIYRKVIQDYPKRIRAVYIRDVRSRKRAQRVQEILIELPVPSLLVLHYADAARHAARQGLLNLDYFNSLRDTSTG